MDEKDYCCSISISIRNKKKSKYIKIILVHHYHLLWWQVITAIIIRIKKRLPLLPLLPLLLSPSQVSIINSQWQRQLKETITTTTITIITNPSKVKEKQSSQDTLGLFKRLYRTFERFTVLAIVGIGSNKRKEKRE